MLRQAAELADVPCPSPGPPAVTDEAVDRLISSLRRERSRHPSLAAAPFALDRGFHTGYAHALDTFVEDMAAALQLFVKIRQDLHAYAGHRVAPPPSVP